MRAKPPHRFISSSTRRSGQQIILNPKTRTNKKIKNKTKSPQVVAKEYGIVDIPSKDMHWPKKTIRFKVGEIRSGSKSKITN